MINNKKTIVNVRSPEEFIKGNIIGSINIPLKEIQHRIDDFKKLPYPIILCCTSGSRSGQANAYLNILGIECANGGSWIDLNTKTHRSA